MPSTYQPPAAAPGLLRRLKVHAPKVRDWMMWLLPITVTAYMAITIQPFNRFITIRERWICLLILGVALLAKQRTFLLNKRLLLVSLPYCLWSLLTAVWSEQPILSLLKAGVLLGQCAIFYFATDFWVSQKPSDRCLDYLLPTVAISLWGALTGTVLDPETSGGVVINATNSNMLGSLMNICFPFLLFRFFSSTAIRHRRLFWLVLLLAVVAFTLASRSRSSMMATGLTFTIALACNSRSRGWALIAVILTLGAVTLVWNDQLSQDIQDRYIFKDQETITFSRDSVWEETMRGAQEGGWLGVGYGVSAGSPSTWTGGFTAVGYGREKGNAQLATIEETGIFGMGLALLLLAGLFSQLVRGYRAAVTPGDRDLISVCAGALCGLLIQSVFEAWWVAPGAPESIAFWVMAGVGYAKATQCLPRRLQKISQRRPEMPKARLQVIPPISPRP